MNERYQGRVNLPKDEFRKKKRRRNAIRRGIFYTVSALILSLILFLALPVFRINSYEIKGTQYSDMTNLNAGAQTLIGKHMFFHSNSELLEYAGRDPFIEKITVHDTIGRKAVIEVTEKKRDWALKSDDSYLIADRHGTVLQKLKVVPEGVTELLDTASAVQVGKSLYKDSDKGKFILQYMDLMDKNTSNIKFSSVDITDMENIRLKYHNWTVELGKPSDLKKVLNQAINILKELKIEESGTVDLKYEGAPYIRKKAD